MSEDVFEVPTSPNKKNAASPIPKHAPSKKNKSPHSLLWLEEKYNSARGETALWVAVITQAMMDALSGCKKSESRYQKHEATRWLTEGGKDFVDVCLAAGMDPDYVRRKAKKALAAPVPWRAEAGKGKRYLERKAYRERMREEAAKAKQEAEETPTVINGPWLKK